MNIRPESRLGVASIIGGVFLILIIISSYTIFILSNRATNDLQTNINIQNSMEADKNQEGLLFRSIVPDANGVILEVINSGSKPLTVDYYGTNDIQRWSYSFVQLNRQITPGKIESFTIPISGFDLAHTYVIKLITNRGRIFTFSYNP